MSGEVLLLSLGGTIASTPGPSRALTPTLDGQGIAALTGPMGSVTLHAETLASVPGASVTVALLSSVHERASAWLHEHSVGGAGVVVTTGTDTLEEIAFLLDLHWSGDAALVVTGAMRAPGHGRSDATDNLSAAVRVAAAESARDRGVLVVMNGRIYEAATATKSHSSSVRAFRATTRAVGSVGPDGIRFTSPPRARQPLARDFSAWRHAGLPWVPIIVPTLADPPLLIRTTLDAGARGLVLAAWGVGHVPEHWMPDIARSAAQVPVVLTTSTGAGSISTGTYGFPGSETSLLQAGVLPGGFLTPRKARAWLCTAIVHRMGEDEIRSALAGLGHRPSSRQQGRA